MNRLVIVGNGFDLAHGLKTSYKDFIVWYLDRFISDFFASDAKYVEDGSYRCYKWQKEDVLLDLESHVDYLPFGIRIPGIDVYNDYKTGAKEPWKLLYKLKHRTDFSIEISDLMEEIIKNVDTKGWTDIENDYYLLLKDYVQNKKPCKSLNMQLDYLRGKLCEYLQTLQHTKSDSSVENLLSKNVCLDDVSQSTIDTIESRKPEGFTWEDDDILKIKETVLLDFNYTNTTNNYKGKTITVNHIHGSLSEPEKIIFGYGDELDKDFKMLEDTNDNELLKNSKSVKYLETGNYRDLLRFINGGPFQVFIMGHSCGNSDRTLLNTIFEHKSCVSIKPFCFQYKDANGDTRDNYSELTQNIYRNFKDKTLFRDRVVNKEQCTTFLGARL